MTTDLCDIATRVSQALFDHTGDPLATATLAGSSHDPRRMTYINAGHPPGLLLRPTGALHLESGGPPLGLLTDASDELTSIDLAPGDVGVLVADGATEAIEGFSLALNQALESRRRFVRPSRFSRLE
jgi:serine phosphatase RsbU (regulator of sigma subunit)